MTTSTDQPATFDELLTAFLATRAGDVASVRAASTMTAAIEGRLVSAPRARERQTRLMVVFAVVAALIVALVAAIVTGGSRSTMPISSPVASPVAPSVVPSRALSSDRFVSETSFGTFDWTRLTTERGIYAWADLGDNILGVDDVDGSWWLSQDGITWTVSEEPAWVGYSADFVRAGADTLALVSSGGYGTMMGAASFRQVLSRDWTDGPFDAAIQRRVGTGWEAIDFPTVDRPAADGLHAYGPNFTGVAALSEVDWVAPVLHMLEVPWGDIYGRFPWAGPDGDPTSQDPWPIWNVAEQRLDIVKPGEIGSALASLTVDLVDGDEPVIEFRDSKDDRLVHTVAATLPGWSPTELLTVLRGWGMDDMSFVVSRGGEIVVARPPWPMDEDWGDSIVTARGRYYALSMPLGENYGITAVHIWGSDDGVTWDRLASPDLPSRLLTNASLVGGPQGLTLSVATAIDDPVWTSTDGRSWTDGEAGQVAGPAQPTSFGWLIADGAGVTIVSTDGNEWERLALPTTTESTVKWMHDRVLLGPREGAEGYVSWVGRLTDP